MPKLLHTNIKIPATKGRKVIADADGMFSYIDSCFEIYNADKAGDNTTATELAVLELDTNMTFTQMFPNPQKQALTQAQIIAFVKNHKDKLRTEGYATFFLFKSGEEFFVARVYFSVDGSLEVGVRRFENGRVWCASHRHRVVVATDSLGSFDLDTLNLSNLGTLKQKIIEKYGEKDGNRFNKYFDIEENDADCFLWKGAHDSDGYGNFGIGGREDRKFIKPHRLTYEVVNGEISKGLVIDHLCRVRDCVNPTHMEAVTIKENIKRGEAILFQKIPATEALALNTGHLDTMESLTLRIEKIEQWISKIKE